MIQTETSHFQGQAFQSEPSAAALQSLVLAQHRGRAISRDSCLCRCSNQVSQFRVTGKLHHTSTDMLHHLEVLAHTVISYVLRDNVCLEMEAKKAWKDGTEVMYSQYTSFGYGCIFSYEKYLTEQN